MCKKFVILPPDEMQQVLEGLEQGLPFARDIDALDHAQIAYPGCTVPVIVPQGGKLQLRELCWGFPADWQKSRVFNTRIETALGPNPGMWRLPITGGRCIVATGGFFESHQSETRPCSRSGKPIKVQYRFEDPEGYPLLLAAVASDDYFSVVTTAPNASVASVHDRMPLVLRQAEVARWLGQDYGTLADRSVVQLAAQPEDAGVSASPSGSRGVQESLF